METKDIHIIDEKKTWETPTVVEISKATILGGLVIGTEVIVLLT